MNINKNNTGENVRNKRLLFITILSIILIFTLSSCTPKSDIKPEGKQNKTKVLAETENKETKVKKEETKSSNYSFDNLQKLFIMTNPKLTPGELEAYCDKTGLFYIPKTFDNGSGEKTLSYVISVKEGTKDHRVSDSGDHMEVDFDLKNKEFKYAEYCMENKSDYTALNYNYGVWCDFRSSAPNSYSGTYIFDFNGNDQGVEFKQDDVLKKTNFFKVDSNEQAIEKIIDKENRQR